MRIAIDMQGALTHGSRTRGIGRYTSGLVSAMAQVLGDYDLRLMLNDNHPTASRQVAHHHAAWLPKTAMTSYRVPHTEGFAASKDSSRRQVADAIVRRHAAMLNSDVLLWSSIFEQAREDFSPIDLARYPAKIKAVIVYDLIPLLFEQNYLGDPAIRSAYHEKLDTLRSADLLLAISESARRDIIAHLGVAPERVVNISAATDSRFRKLDLSAARRSALASRLKLTRPFVIYVAGADARKNLDGAVTAFAALPKTLRETHQLLLVTNLDAAGRERQEQRARQFGIEPDGLVVARDIDDDDLIGLMNMTRALLFPSLYEGFGLPVLEAMQCGIPVVAADTSSIPEIVDRQDILFDASDPASGGRILELVLTDEALRRDLADWGPRRAKAFSWERSAARALEAIEARVAALGGDHPHVPGCELLDLDGARAELADILVDAPECDPEIDDFVADLTFSVPSFANPLLRRLLVDVTDCRRSTAWTGIQRVVRKLTTAFYEQGHADAGFIPVAVRLDGPEPQSALDFVSSIMGRPLDGRSHPIEIRAGDDLFMLDSNWSDFLRYAPLFEEIRRHDGRVFTCIYDIIPELHPDVCGDGMPEAHARWLHAAIEHSHGLICISRAVADEVAAYIDRLGLTHRPGLQIGWFHCGSDLHRTGALERVQPHVAKAFDGRRPTFLAVGTLEPRKAHALALDAFELLWARGIDASLCFIGARGWKIDDLESRIRSHREHGIRLFWFNDARDADVAQAYARAETIICMSMAEGFGLPIAEAARMGRPVICSDIPVFREVGGEGAVYFRSGDPRSLAGTVKRWLDGRVKADPAKVSRSSWDDAAKRIRQIIYGGDWYRVLG